MRLIIQHRFILVLLFLSMLSGCVQDYVLSRPIIKQNPYWEIVEGCGYEHCGPMVDFLSSSDIRIRIEARYNYTREKIFVIEASFLDTDFYTLTSPKSDEYEFDSSAVMVKLGNGTVLKPKGFTCSYTRWDLEYLRSAPPLSGSIPISENHCFLLFFDYPTPSVEEEFTMNLDGLKRNGEAVEVPTVYFKKGISRY